MKPKIIFAILIASTLAACGGGGGGSNTSGTNSGGASSGGDSGGGTNGTATACTISNTNPLIAVALTGGAGTAQFSSGGAKLAYSGNLSGTLSLVQDANAPAPLNKACMDSTGNSSTSMRTVMQSNGALGVSHTVVNGVDQPVLLMDTTALASNTNLGAWEGTYTVLRYEKITPAQTNMFYFTIKIDGNGNWSLCENTSTCSPGVPKATGTLAAHSGNSYAFDLSSGVDGSDMAIRATAFMVGAGDKRTLVVTESETGGGGEAVTAMWLGVPQTTWNPVAGSYILNTTDGIQNTIKIESPQNLIVNNQNKALTANTPSTGIATAKASDGTDAYLIASPAGFLVIGSDYGNEPAFFSFGVMP